MPRESPKSLSFTTSIPSSRLGISPDGSVLVESPLHIHKLGTYYQKMWVMIPLLLSGAVLLDGWCNVAVEELLIHLWYGFSLQQNLCGKHLFYLLATSVMVHGYVYEPLYVLLFIRGYTTAIGPDSPFRVPLLVIAIDRCLDFIP